MRAGDEEAFRQLVGRYRRNLSLHCHQILGSMHGAEDALKEPMFAFFAYWRSVCEAELDPLPA